MEVILVSALLTTGIADPGGLLTPAPTAAIPGTDIELTPNLTGASITEECPAALPVPVIRVEYGGVVSGGQQFIVGVVNTADFSDELFDCTGECMMQIYILFEDDDGAALYYAASLSDLIAPHPITLLSGSHHTNVRMTIKKPGCPTVTSAPIPLTASGTSPASPAVSEWFRTHEGVLTDTSGTACDGGISLEQDTDRPGSDYQNFDIETSNPCECARRCVNDSECRAFTYVRPGVQGTNAKCWLKNSIPEPQHSSIGVSGVKGNVTSPASPAVSEWFRTHEGVIANTSGTSCGVGISLEQDTDRPGSDYQNFDVETPDPCECARRCVNDSACKAFTYVRPGVQATSARCWLKNSIPEPQHSTIGVSGVKGNATSPASPAVSEWFRTHDGLIPGSGSSSDSNISRLGAPVQISPAEGSVFSTYPRTTRYVWNPVSGAARYTLEIDCLHCCVVNQWCEDSGRTWDLITGITTTSSERNFVGKQQGRWRVWAVSPSGIEGEKSPWRKFEYTV